MTTLAIGIDIGGTGIKGAVVDVGTGDLVSERVKVATPPGGEPDDIVAAVVEMVDGFGEIADSAPVGVCFPAVVLNGRTMSAANVSKAWIGLEAEKLFEASLKRDIHFVNDADAAGVAEARYGAAKGRSGLVILTTLGTGHRHGVPLQRHPHPEHRARAHGAGRQGRRDPDVVRGQGAQGTQLGGSGRNGCRRYYEKLEMLFSPILFIVGGGVSKSDEEFLPLLDAAHADRARRRSQQRRHPGRGGPRRRPVTPCGRARLTGTSPVASPAARRTNASRAAAELVALAGARPDALDEGAPTRARRPAHVPGGTIAQRRPRAGRSSAALAIQISRPSTGSSPAIARITMSTTGAITATTAKISSRSSTKRRTSAVRAACGRLDVERIDSGLGELGRDGAGGVPACGVGCGFGMQPAYRAERPAGREATASVVGGDRAVERGTGVQADAVHVGDHG